MGWFVLAHIFSVLITIVSLGRLSEREKDLEILVLRQQLAIMKRKQGQPIRANRVEKMTLAVLGKNLHPSASNQLRQAFGDTCQP